MRLILLITCLLIFDNALSQECFAEKRKDKRLVKKIKSKINDRLFYAALDDLSFARKLAVFSALKTEVLWHKADFYNARIEGLKVIDMCPDNFPKVYFFLGEIAFARKDYVSAEIYLAKSLKLGVSDVYISDASNLYSKSKSLADIINNPVAFTPLIVGGISTSFDEYLPLLSPDQDFYFFTRRFDESDLNSIVNTTVEKFIVSNKFDGKFDVGNSLPYPFNQEDNEGGASVTIDNSILYYTKCIRNETGYNNCDIYYVELINGLWSDVHEFSDKISRSDSWDSQPSISSDGSTLIFSSDRMGGHGKMDLYQIDFISGEWTEPKNLGTNINSSENEKSPYLHTDGRTLFFSSTNFPSLGGFDIFYSRKDSLGNWQKPINIGFPINTASDETSLSVSTDGNNGYFASNQFSGVGGWDIYSFRLHDGAKPERVLFMKGKLLDGEGRVINDVNLEVKNISTNEVTYVSVKEGSYVSSLTLSENDDVLISIKKHGFAFTSIYVSSNDSSFYSPIKLDIKLERLDKGKSFNLSNIYFDSNSHDLNSVVIEILIEFAKYLIINNTLVIEINGFTDNIGNEINNRSLSKRRSNAVREFLLSNGISSERVLSNGFGELFPIGDNSSDLGRASNRRIEFKIISK